MDGELFRSSPLPSGPMAHGCVVAIDGMIEGRTQKLFDRVIEHIRQAMISARHRGPDPDYPPLAPVTAEDLERLVRRIASENEPGIHVHNRGNPGPPKWLNKLIWAVATGLILSAITTTATTIVVVASIRTMLTDYIKSNDQRVGRVEQQTDDNTRRLDRGAGLP